MCAIAVFDFRGEKWWKMVENGQSVAKLLRLQSVALYRATENVGPTTDVKFIS